MRTIYWKTEQKLIICYPKIYVENIYPTVKVYTFCNGVFDLFSFFKWISPTFTFEVYAISILMRNKILQRQCSGECVLQATSDLSIFTVNKKLIRNEN